jgi:hypothetical protein
MAFFVRVTSIPSATFAIRCKNSAGIEGSLAILPARRNLREMGEAAALGATRLAGVAGVSVWPVLPILTRSWQLKLQRR